MSQYPEHDKLRLVKDQSQIIGQFLEWLGEEKGFAICERVEDYDGWYPRASSIESILADYFSIDQKKIANEKDAMLDEIRATRN